MKKKQELEFRYYEVPQGESVLALLGESWVRPYGTDPVTGDLIKSQHFHNLMEIGYCIKGNGELVLDESAVHYSDGMLTAIPANYPHTTYSYMQQLNTWEYIFFDPTVILAELYPGNELFVGKVLTQLNRKARYWFAGDNDRLVSIVRILMDECRDRGSYSLESIKGLLQAMIMLIVRTDSVKVVASESFFHEGEDAKSGDLSWGQVLKYIDANYMKDFRIEELANISGMSETHFRRLFSSYMNMSPTEYINYVRIKNACNMIETTSYSMEQIADKVGYTSMSTFNRNFKKILDTTPYHFKKSEENYRGKLLEMNVRAKKGW